MSLKIKLPEVDTPEKEQEFEDKVNKIIEENAGIAFLVSQTMQTNAMLQMIIDAIPKKQSIVIPNMKIK